MRVNCLRIAGAMLALATCGTSLAQTTELTWNGHAAFTVKTPKGKILLIDPWLRNPLNPAAKEGADPVAALEKVDYILITHGHGDHVGEAVEIAKRTGAQLVSNPELAANLVSMFGFPKKQASNAMGVGGEITVADGEVTIAMTPAVHSSGLVDEKAGAGEVARVYGGIAAGYVLRIRQGPTIYHSGDTAYFGDMAVIGQLHPIDVALVNIGGRFGMEPPMAAKAAKALRARLAIPHHYATSPPLTQSAAGFAADLKRERMPFLEMKPGMTIRYEGTRRLQ